MDAETNWLFYMGAFERGRRYALVNTRDGGRDSLINSPKEK
jgi:hypothetical protein